jgi:hypothetical protein
VHSVHTGVNGWIRNPIGVADLAGVALLRRAARTARLERIAPPAVTDIEVIPDHREHHRVGAVQQLAVLDSLEVHVGEDVGRAMAVPTRLVAGFGLEWQLSYHVAAVYGELDRW